MLKKLSKNKLKFKYKPRITPGLQKSISIKNQFLSKFIKLKDPNKKKEAHIRYKQYRNVLSTLVKKSKQFDFTRFFQENFKDLKNMRRGIEKIISSNNSNYTFPTAITVHNETITNPSDIANAFNNYFAKVAINIQSSIRFSKKKYYDYLPPLNIELFFLTPADKTEVSNIIFSLNQNKSDEPNSIPIKILKLLNRDISDQVAILFNKSFSSGIFPSILKTSKIIPIYKKGSKLDQFLCYLILTKFWKYLCITDFITF